MAGSKTARAPRSRPELRSAPAVCDPRETAPEFVALAPEVQAELRLGWRESDARDERVRFLERWDRKRGMLEAWLLVGFTELCLYGFDWLHLFAASALAILIGEAWWRCRAGQMATPAIAASASLSLQMLWLVTGHGNAFTLLTSTSFIAFASAYLGLRRGQRGSE
ncbi:MAG TPA: hypothetical protein VK843_14405 [Planctomycetota bacterium]|nr:hypothetical protein [Planctomycetota bacterium]